jgi:hypothetical protein
VFAGKYDIGSLRRLAIHKLRRTLVEFILYKKQVEAVLHFLQYTYINTADRATSTDGLRMTVIHYAACVVEELAGTDTFQSFLEEWGSFTTDLVTQMIKRLD